MKIVSKSLILLQLEKMTIILKEMEHIENILKFYEGYEMSSEKLTKPIKRNIEFLKKDIENLRDKIRILKGINKQFYDKEIGINSTNLLFIIQYDYVRTQIEDMLRVIQVLYNKMGQLFGEALNQYIPYPILGRRYSNNAIMMYLENYYRRMLDKFSDDDKTKLILGWNYRAGFQYRIFVNKDIKRENYKDDTYNNYIDLPYWYYELPFLLPSITHEVIYIALRNPKSILKDKYESLRDDIKAFFDDKNNDFIQKIGDILGFDEYPDDLAKEIICDLFGYKMHKESYISALFHNVIGEKLAKDFLKVHHTYKKEECNILPNDWSFLQKKDHSILRLHFLLKLCPKLKKDTRLIEMQNILNAIMPLRIDIQNENKDELEGFEKIYTYNYPNFKPSYTAVQNYLKQLLYCIVNWSEKNEFDICDIEDSPDFGNIWKERYDEVEKPGDTVPHQNNFRRQINGEISKIEYVKNSKDKSLAYLMTLKKIRKDNKNEKNIITKLIDTEYSRNNENNLEYFITYGMYDGFSLKNKKNTYNVTNMLEEFLKPKKQEIKYFNTKQVLTKVYDSIESKESKNGNFSVVLNIELLKNVNNSNGYSDLKGAIEKIANILQGKKSDFKKADIFKSLGPKDITIVVKESYLETIFELVELLNQQEQIMRTFTMICSMAYSNQILKLPTISEKKFRLVSILRLSKSGHNEIQDIINEYLKKEKIDDIVEITGVMDIRITWKTKSIEDIFEFYNELTGKSIITDCQTRIERFKFIKGY